MERKQFPENQVRAFELFAFPPIRQKKGEWMGHGVGTN
jgi:hypothetical protein